VEAAVEIQNIVNTAF